MGAVTALVSAQMVSFLLVRLRVLVACLVVGAFGAMSLLGGCSAGQDNSSVRLPAPIESTTIGPGDVFTVQVVGEKELPTEYQVASDGTVDFPYVHTTKVAGLEPQAMHAAQGQCVRRHLHGGVPAAASDQFVIETI